MAFGMELGDERCRFENGEGLTACRTNWLCMPAAMVVAAMTTRAEPSLACRDAKRQRRTRGC